MKCGHFLPRNIFHLAATKCLPVFATHPDTGPQVVNDPWFPWGSVLLSLIELRESTNESFMGLKGVGDRSCVPGSGTSVWGWSIPKPSWGCCVPCCHCWVVLQEQTELIHQGCGATEPWAADHSSRPPGKAHLIIELFPLGSNQCKTSSASVEMSDLQVQNNAKFVLTV